MKRHYLLLSIAAWMILCVSKVQGTVTFKLSYNSTTQVYTVSFNSTVAYNGNLARIMPSTQVTIVAPDPDGGGPGGFAVTNLTSLTALNWGTSQLNSPPENPTRDYLFFSPTNAGSYPVFNIPANTDIDLFSFKSAVQCSGGPLSLYDNITDPLNSNPNFNADNNFRVLGGGNVNLYSGNSSGPVSGGSLNNITAVTTDVSCFGGNDGTGTVIAADGTPPYSYAWPPSAGNQTTQTVTNLSAGSYIVTVTDSGVCEGTVTVTIDEPAQLTASTSVLDHVSCFGEATGSVTVTPGGGTLPYVYSWTGGAADQTLNDLLAGTYTVTVTDGNGCTVSASAIVNEPAQALIANITASTNASCFGEANGSATAAGNGGTSPYTYLWSNGSAVATASGLLAGTYTVTVTDSKSCTATATVSITEPTALSVSISAQTNVLCKGASTGSASLSVSGGVISYSYLWPVSAGSQTTATATGLSAGSYTATVTDGQGCTKTITANITEPAAALAVTVAGTNVSCGGSGDGSAIANPSGGTPGFTYLWSTGELTAKAINLATGTYTVTVTDQHGCTVSASVLIGQNTGTVTYKLSLDPDGQTYRVSFNSSVAYSGAFARISGSSQFALVFPDPDGAGAGAVQLASVTSLTDLDMDYTQLNNPAENPGKDYAFFAPTNAGSYNPFNIPANTDIDLFTFKIVNGCTGSVSLFHNYADLLNNDPNVGADNSFKTLGGGNNDLYCNNTSGDVACSICLLTNITAVTTDVSCFSGADGEATIVAADGVPPYSYAWPASAGNQTTQFVNNLTAGTYTVTVTDAVDCTGTVSLTITEPPVLTGVASVVNHVLCYGESTGTAMVTIGGGTPGYSILWTGGSGDQTVTNLSAGTYTVTVTDSKSCTVTSSAIITQPAQALTATITATTHASCSGGSDGAATVTPLGGTSPYLYLWSDGQTDAAATNLAAGIYTVTVTDDSDCTATVSVTINQPTALNATVGAQTNVLCKGASTGAATIVPAGGTPAYTFLWPASAGNQTTATATGLAAGTYTATVTDAQSCTATVSVTITEPALALLATTAGVNVSCGGTDNGSATATPAGGTPGYTYLWSTGDLTASIQNLAVGTYTVTVTDQNGCTVSSSVVIGQNTGTVTYKLTLDPDGQTLRVSFNSSIPYSGPLARISGSSQFTLVFPDPDGAGPGVVQLTNITSLTDLVMDYTQLNNPAANPANDYAFFAPTNAGSYNLFDIPANTDIDLFTFKILDGCTGSVSLYDSYADLLNSDPNVDADNSFKTLGGGNTDLYCNNSSGPVPCPTCLLSNITILPTNVSCFGGSDGSATAIPADGVPTYSFLWSNGETTQTVGNLIAGTYTVTVTDGEGCTGTATVSITEPTALTATATLENPVSCFGGSDGSASVSALGGTPGYIYLWTNGSADQVLTGLTAGIYTVTVTDANGCTKTASVTVTEPATAVTVSISTQTNVSCFNGSDGSATASGSGGTGSINYLWSNGQALATAIGLLAGTYTVTATDANGCTATVSVTITEPPALSISISADNVLCNGGNSGALTAVVNGGTPGYFYDWNGTPVGDGTASITGLTAGTYTVTVTDDNTCSITMSATITEPTVIIATLTGTNPTCFGLLNGSVEAEVNGGVAPYEFSLNGGPYQNSNVFTGLGAGNYTVTARDANGCTMNTNAVTLTEPNLVTANINASTNPSCNLNNGSATVSAGGGTLPYTYAWSNGSADATATDLGAGTYTVTVSDANGCTATTSVTLTNTADVTDPSITCPADIAVGTDVDQCTAVVAYAVPTATDDCPGVSLSLTAGPASGAAFGLGATVVEYTATDAAGNTATCSFTITVSDLQEPTAACQDITIDLDGTGNASITASDVDGGSSDNCPAGLTLAIDISAFGCGDAGDNNVTLTVTDGAGNASACVSTVTVRDATAPSFTCPSAITLASCADAVPDLLTGISDESDNCGTPALSQSPAAGVAFNGQTTVTVTATDASGNTATCDVAVSIVDGTAPTIACPADIATGTDAGLCTATVTYSVPTAADDCPGVSAALTAGPASGSAFGLGATVVEYTATDAAGNTATCSFTITVSDLQEPTAACQDITVDLDGTGNITITASDVDGGSSDNCPAGLSFAISDNSFDCGDTGDNNVTLTVTDGAGNASTCVSTVTVRDATAPSFTCPSAIIVSGCDALVPDVLTGITDEADNCGIASVTQNPVAGTDFGNASGNSIDITVTVTDVNGNATTCTVTVTIEDTSAPVFVNCPADITVGNDVDECGANVTFSDPIATDNCPSVTVIQTQGLPSGSLFPVGNTLVVFEASDPVENVATCSFTITVTDVQTPTAVCQDITMDLDATGNVTIVASDVDGGSSDNCPASLSFAISDNSFDCGDAGDNNVTLTVTDGAGNVSTCVSTVTVRDVTAPSFTCPAAITLASCADVVPDLLTGISDEADNCGTPALSQSPAAGVAFNGQTTVTVTATDANGNTATCNVTVSITDDTDPVITCPASITTGNDVDRCSSVVTYSVPTVTDDCPGATVSLTLGLASGADFPLGQTTVEYTATDAGGNTATCSFTVTVSDAQAPNAVCKDITVNLSSTINAGSVTVTAAQIDGGSTDNCTAAANLVLAPANTAYTCANVGDNNITLTVTDAAGNVSTCVATVTVKDVTAPTFTCPSPVTVPNCTSTVPNVISGLVASDNCGVASIVQDPVAGTDFGQVNGNTVIVTVLVTDVNGNVATCGVSVTIADAGPPTFVDCPTNMIMIGNDPDQCSGKVNWPIPVALDDCLPLANVVQTAGPVPGSVIAITCPPTPITVSYKATDGAGNMATCSFQVLVMDTQKPDFDADVIMPADITVECNAVPTNCVFRANGTCTPLTLSDINDNCAGNLSVLFNEVSTASPNPSSCNASNYTLTRTWTITDCAGNSRQHTQVITVHDLTKPTAVCKNITVTLNDFGTISILPRDLDGGSTDNCASNANLTFTASQTVFTCADLVNSPVSVILTVTDPCGNFSTCTALVTILQGNGNCNPVYDIDGSDPCVCLDNATTLDNGQFSELIQVHGLAGQTWTIVSSTGLYLSSSPAPPAVPNAVANGTLLVNGQFDGLDNDGDLATDELDERVYYTFSGRHVDGQGYTAVVRSNLGTDITIENKCYYPTPYFADFVLDDPLCIGTPPFPIQVKEFNNATGAVVPGSVMVNGVVTNVFDAGTLGVGNHTVMATFDAFAAKPFTKVNGIVVSGSDQEALSDPGCRQKITKIVNVVETPTTLICNDLVYVSIDADCQVTTHVDDVLEGTYYCYDDYTVEVDKTLPYGNGPWVPANFDASDIGKTYFYHVTHTSGGGNVCWGQIKIEDKLVPGLSCPANLVNACSESTGVQHTGNVTVSECSAYTTVIDDEYTDFGQCNDPRGQLVRTWIVTDAWGNQASCAQTITITSFDLDDVVFPADAVVDCEVTYLNPSGIASVNTGEPSINGASIVGSTWCGAQVGFEDTYFYGCGGTFTILRKWGVLNNCAPLGPGNPISHTQKIQVIDLGGPTFVCPPAVTVSSDPFTCCSTAGLPDMVVSEGCSGILGLEAKVTGVDPNNGNIITFTVPGHLEDFAGNNWWNPDTLAVFDYTQCLPLGVYNVRYKASDHCGNTSYCNFELIVADLVPPAVSCDQFTKVALGADGTALVNASTFDDGTTDNCCLDRFEVRRMNPNDCQTDSVFHPQARFCCSDQGDTILVVFRAWDCHGNYNDCMVSVLVEDKIKPSCTPPAQVSVNCENFDPSLWAYGIPSLDDNCCLDTTKVFLGQIGLTHQANYSLFDTVCNKGTITRTFRAFDCAGNSSQCTQRVIVNYLQDYYVKFPNDAIVTVCDGTGNFGEPIFYGEDCELLGVSFTDEIFTVVPDACFKIERTWNIINWCTFNPNLDFIYVPNPNPNPQVNNSANLPGPTVSACGTLAPWAPTNVKINPTDPQATNFCTYWEQNANGYKYKQIIKVTDGQAPTGTYVVPACDNQNWLTANSGELWNEAYWWHNGLQTHDLCEEPTELCITGTDACSGSNVNIEYLLFLDLDGDGTMETVINSVNTGIAGLGWNNVLYDNLNTPNFAGGTPRAFDERPVAANQKYGFAIQETVSGNNKTACVRWNTQQSQNTYTVPELPHGTHKIKWFVTDGCGNNKEYEYTFTVKDCKAPTVVCLNGLSVNIMPTAMIQLWASDFLQYTEDNCTPAGQLKIGVRKCGTGTGFPIDPATGQPITSVTFTCDELGTQCVELWSIDAEGNADYCETYVIVQDNLGNCPTAGHINVAGALKTEMQDGVEEGIVNIDGTSSFTPPYSYFDLSDANGLYQLVNSVPLDATFTIAPEKDDNPLNGVTTYDLVLISKHILGLEPLNTPYKMIAADANKSGSITTFDIVEIRKLILGIYSELPNNTSWRFVDRSYVFPNPLNPFQELFPETISVADAMTSQTGEDFVGVKIGDVNNTAVANAAMQAEERTTGTALFDVEDREVKAGEEFEVTFKAAQALKGFQFTMLLNGLEALGAVETDRVTAANFGLIFDGAATVSIDGAQAFTLRFRAAKSGKLSEMLGVSGSITRAEAYAANDLMTNDAMTRLGIAFRFSGKTIAGQGFELYQNQPNPFVNKTSIGFYLPEAAEAKLTVVDESGRIVYQQKAWFQKGENAFQIDRSLNSDQGVLWYKVETENDSASRSMIHIKE